MTAEELNVFWAEVDRLLSEQGLYSEDDLEYRHKLLVKLMSEVIPYEICDALEEIEDIDIMSGENYAITVMQILAEENGYELKKKKSKKK